jgi:hypothetical protein
VVDGLTRKGLLLFEIDARDGVGDVYVTVLLDRLGFFKLCSATTCTLASERNKTACLAQRSSRMELMDAVHFALEGSELRLYTLNRPDSTHITMGNGTAMPRN